jgi:hypothetical protein
MTQEQEYDVDRPIVLSLCDKSCAAVLDWADAGYRCICVDIEAGPSPHPNIETVREDVHWYYPPQGHYAFAMAWSPCTDLAVSGARWFKAKGLKAFADGALLFERTRRIVASLGCPYLNENPIGVLSTYHRKPDYIVHPWEFAGYLDNPEIDNTTKATCLWTGGGFVLPEKRPAAEPHRHDCHLAPPSEDRGDIRSVTPRGLAKALFMAHHRRAVAA